MSTSCKKEISGISLSTYCYTTWVSATSLSSWLERRQGLFGLSSLGFTFLPGVVFFLPSHTLTLILSPVVSLRTTEVGKETCWNLWRFRPDCLGRKLSILQASYSLFGMNLTIFCCDLLMILCNYVLCKLPPSYISKKTLKPLHPCVKSILTILPDSAEQLVSDWCMNGILYNK